MPHPNTIPVYPVRPGHYIDTHSRIKWRLLIYHTGAFFLYEVSLLSTDRSPDVIEKLLQRYRCSESWLAKVAPFWLPTIYTATLAPVPIETLTDLPCLVDVDTQHYSHVLTAALRYPSHLPETTPFLPSYTRFAITPEPPNNTVSRDAILIKLQPSKLALLVFSTITFAISAIAGGIAGVLRNSLDSGFGAFGIIIGVVGIVEGYAAWRLS